MNGITDELFEIKALGKRVSVNHNADEIERALNRRVEIELLIKKEPVAKIIETPIFTNEVEVTINGIVVNEISAIKG